MTTAIKNINDKNANANANANENENANANATLHMILGPMFSGKSTALINKTNELLQNGVSNDEILLINHKFDNRYCNYSSICTHDGIKLSSIALTNLSKLITYNSDSIDNNNKFINAFSNEYFDDNKIKYILIDEGQFFNDLYDVVKILLLQYKKTIYIAGLDGDFKQQPFYESKILELIPFASSVQKLCARCNICNDKAYYTKRIIDSDTQILIGDSETYMAVCLNHLY